MNKILLSAVALALAVPATAQVQVPTAPVAPIAPRADVSHSRDQMVAKVRDRFAKMDTNRDGFVAGDELRPMRGHRQAMADPAKAFDRIDANRDGMISRDEFAKGREIRIERKVVVNGAPGAPGAGLEGQRRRMMKMHRMGGMGGRMMKMADLDRDGRVSLQEATTSALQHFDRIDANRDGRITPDERSQQREQRKAMRGQRTG